jgi:hypothetical protein
MPLPRHAVTVRDLPSFPKGVVDEFGYELGVVQMSISPSHQRRLLAVLPASSDSAQALAGYGRFSLPGSVRVFLLDEFIEEHEILRIEDNPGRIAVANTYQLVTLKMGSDHYRILLRNYQTLRRRDDQQNA